MTQAVIFDLDGTLIDSAPDIHAAANTVFERHGMDPFTLTEARGFVGHGAGVFIDRCLAARERSGDDALRETLLQGFLDLYESAVNLTQLYPGVPGCLDTLEAQGRGLGICTNKPEAPTRAVLAHLEITDRFRVMVGGDTLPVRKPEPDPLKAAILRMEARDVVFVGDSEVDAETAQRAGVPFALYTEGYRRSPVEDMPHDAKFDDFAQLPEIVAALLR